MAEFYAHRGACKKCRNAQRPAYRKPQDDEIKAYQATYYATHKQDILARRVAYREDKRTYDAAYRRTATGKESARKHGAKRRALKSGNTPAHRMLTGEQWDSILKASKGCCYWCGKRSKPTMDHVLPLSKGGQHTAENVVVSCMSCNLKKYAKIVTLF